MRRIIHQTQQEQPVEKYCYCEELLGYVPLRCIHDGHCGKTATAQTKGEKA